MLRNNTYPDKVSYSFGKKAQTYDANSQVQQSTADLIMSSLSDCHPKRILDIGCGTGHLTERLLNVYPVAQVVAIDNSVEMVDACRDKLGEAAAYHVMDAEALDTTALLGKFDLIVSNMTVQWFENPEESIRAWTEHLNSEGQIILSTLAPENWREWKDAIYISGSGDKLINAPLLPDEMVIDTVEIKENYGSAIGFLRHLRNTGAITPRQGSSLFEKSGDLMRTISAYDQKYNGDITWEIAIARLQL